MVKSIIILLPLYVLSYVLMQVALPHHPQQIFAQPKEWSATPIEPRGGDCIARKVIIFFW